jgi:hypothetical protein
MGRPIKSQGKQDILSPQPFIGTEPAYKLLLWVAPRLHCTAQNEEL